MLHARGKIIDTPLNHLVSTTTVAMQTESENEGHRYAVRTILRLEKEE